MSAQSAMIAALEAGDAKRCAAIHSELFPHLPPPEGAEAAEVAMHMARTQIEQVSERARLYSHAWLTERGLPSQLPDHLKPKAQRLYPRIAEAVLVSCNTNSQLLKPVAAEAQRAMSDAVEDCYANGDKDPTLVRSRMLDAKARTFSKLLGTTGGIPHG